MDREDDVEAAVVRMIEEDFDGEALKLKLDAKRGFPDRTILLPGGLAMFLELKRPVGGRPSPQQIKWVERLSRLGFITRFCNSIDDARREASRLSKRHG